MQVLEKTIPWWRKALKFALGGIRSGFGFFSRPARLEPVAVPVFSDGPEENAEEERALTKPFPKIEVAAETPEIPAEPETLPKPVAEPEPLPESPLQPGLPPAAEMAAEWPNPSLRRVRKGVKPESNFPKRVRRG